MFCASDVGWNWLQLSLLYTHSGFCFDSHCRRMRAGVIAFTCTADGVAKDPSECKLSSPWKALCLTKEILARVCFMATGSNADAACSYFGLALHLRLLRESMSVHQHFWKTIHGRAVMLT